MKEYADIKADESVRKETRVFALALTLVLFQYPEPVHVKPNKRNNQPIKNLSINNI